MMGDLPFSSSVAAALGLSGTPCTNGGKAQACTEPCGIGGQALTEDTADGTV